MIPNLRPSSTPKPIQASRPQNIVLESRLRVGFFYRKTGERAAERNVCSENRTAGCGNTLVFRDDLFSAQRVGSDRACSSANVLKHARNCGALSVGRENPFRQRRDQKKAEPSRASVFQLRLAA